MKKKLVHWDFIALALTILTVIFQFTGYFFPKWWVYDDPSDASFRYVGMIKSIDCQSEASCEEKSAITIEGGKEWLFITRIFQTFGALLSFLALVLHIIYIILRRKSGIRSVSIYMLGGGGLFILGGSFVFVALYKSLTATDENAEYQSIQAPVFLCILSGILSIAAAALTAVATVKKANQFDDDEDTFT